MPIVRYLIKSAKDDSDGITLNIKNILLGKNLKDEAKVDMWTNYILNSIYPPVLELRAQLYGMKKYDIRTFEFALNDLLESLTDVNDELKMNTFLTSNNVQLGDLMLSCALIGPYKDVFTKDK